MYRDANGKTCSKCGEYKTWEHYSKDRTSCDGVQSYCRECRKLACRFYRQQEYAKQRRRELTKKMRTENINFRIYHYHNMKIGQWINYQFETSPKLQWLLSLTHEGLILWRELKWRIQDKVGEKLVLHHRRPAEWYPDLTDTRQLLDAYRWSNLRYLTYEQHLAVHETLRLVKPHVVQLIKQRCGL